MNVCAEADIVIAKIIAQGCDRREALDDDASLFFSISSNGPIFCIPKPLLGGGYTEKQLNAIDAALESFSLELLPLDPNLLY